MLITFCFLQLVKNNPIIFQIGFKLGEASLIHISKKVIQLFKLCILFKTFSTKHLIFENL